MSMTRNSRHPFVRIGVFTLLLSVLVISVSAQTNKGTISGTVTDQGGALVQNAVVTVTNMDTAAERAVNTGDDGTYTVPLLDPGKYRINVVPPAALNLKNAIQNDVILQTTQTLAVDISLEPGSVGAEVTITAAPSLVESETSDRGSVVTGREVTELPLSGRNFTQLATLTPGVARASNAGFGGSGPDARQFNNGDPRAGSGGPRSLQRAR